MGVEVQDRNMDSMLSMASSWKEHRVHHSLYQTYNNWRMEAVRHSATSPSVLHITRSLHGHHWQHLVTKAENLVDNDKIYEIPTCLLRLVEHALPIASSNFALDKVTIFICGD